MGPRNSQAIRSMIVDAEGIDADENLSIGSKFDNAVRKLAFGSIRLLSGISSSQHLQHPRDIRRVVLFRYDAIGDYIITTPFIRWLHEVSPNVEIDVVGSYRNASLIEDDPHIRSVVSIDPASRVSASWLKVRSLIKSRQPDVVAALVFTKMTKAALLAMAGGGTSTRLAFDLGGRTEIYNKVFDRLAPHFDAWEHWFETTANVGPRTFSLEEEMPRPYVVVTKKSIDVVGANARETGRQLVVPQHDGVICTNAHTDGASEVEGAPYIVLNVAGGGPERVLSAHIALQIVRRVLDMHPGYMCVVTGPPEHENLIDEIVSTTNSRQCQFYLGTFQEIIVLAACSSMIISPDTAIVHVGSIAGVPILSFSNHVRSLAEWGPFGVPFRTVLSADPTSINSIGADVMLAALEELIADIDLPAVGARS